MLGGKASSLSGQSRGPLVVVDLQPALLGHLLRQHLTDRGVAVLDPLDPAAVPEHSHVAVALVGGTMPPSVPADVVVRLPESGAAMPTVVEVDASDPDVPRVVSVDDVDGLIDLLVTLVGG